MCLRVTMLKCHHPVRAVRSRTPKTTRAYGVHVRRWRLRTHASSSARPAGAYPRKLWVPGIVSSNPPELTDSSSNSYNSRNDLTILARNASRIIVRPASHSLSLILGTLRFPDESAMIAGYAT
jgi:hypothetical protein